MEVAVGKHKFKLEKVSLYISDLYTEYVRAYNAIATWESDIEEARLDNQIEREESESLVDKLKSDRRLFRRLREIRKANDDGLVKASEMRNNVLKEIVELNGYEFDAELWLKGVSEGDFNDIIGELIGAKKKVT